MAASILDRIEQLRRVNPQLLALIEQQQGFAFPVRSGGGVRLTGDKSAALGIKRTRSASKPEVTNNFLDTKWREAQPTLAGGGKPANKKVLQENSNSIWSFRPLKVRGGLSKVTRDRARFLTGGGGALPGEDTISTVVSSDLPDGLRITEEEIARVTEIEEYRIVEEA